MCSSIERRKLSKSLWRGVYIEYWDISLTVLQKERSTTFFSFLLVLLGCHWLLRVGFRCTVNSVMQHLHIVFCVHRPRYHFFLKLWVWSRRSFKNPAVVAVWVVSGLTGRWELFRTFGLFSGRAFRQHHPSQWKRLLPSRGCPSYRACSSVRLKDLSDYLLIWLIKLQFWGKTVSKNLMV